MAVRIPAHSSAPRGELECAGYVLKAASGGRLIAPVVLLLIAVEFEGGQAKVLENRTDELDFGWRTKPLSATTLVIACSSESTNQFDHERIILSRQHLLFHLHKSSCISRQLVSPEILALLIRFYQQRIYMTDNPEISSHLSLKMVTVTAVTM